MSFVGKTVSVFGVVGLSASIATLGVVESAEAANIGKGSDYLVTPPGSSFDFGGDIGLVNFQGVPIGIGDSDVDTIIERKEDAVFDTNGDGILEFTEVTIPIEVVALSMESINPVNVGDLGSFDVLVNLTENTQSEGTMTIQHNSIDLGGGNLGFDDSGTTQGTFTSEFIVSFDALFTPVGGGDGFTVSDSLTLINNGADWSHTPTAENPILVTGPLGNQVANCHVGAVSSGVPPCAETDFFTATAEHGPDDIHITEPAKCEPGVDCVEPVPEPATILGSSIALGFGALLKKQSSRKRNKKDVTKL